MKYKEKEIQNYIWEHRTNLFSMIEEPTFEPEPVKKPWEYEPWELLYYQTQKEYRDLYEYLAGLNLFGCEVGLPKEGDNPIRADFLGCLEGENGFVICELKVNRNSEREAFTEMLAYANHIGNTFTPMGRRDVFYLLISPMEERIVREATMSMMLYDRNRIVVLRPIVDDKIDSLRFQLWQPAKDEFENIAKSVFAPENIDVFRISWRGAKGKWSPIAKGKEPTKKMIHQLNKVAHYAAQLMEADGINGFVFCLQSYPEVRDHGFLENGITVCGINPYKSSKVNYLMELGSTIAEAEKASMEAVKLSDFFPTLKGKGKRVDDDYNYLAWMAENWSSILARIAFDVEKRVNMTFGPADHEHGYGYFTWESYLNRSSEDKLCWNYDICLTGLFREIYDLKLERYYSGYSQYNMEEKAYIFENGVLEKHCIDMMYSQEHIRKFIDSLIGYDESKSIDD